VAALEEMMDAVLLQVSASARLRAPATEADWQRLGAQHLIQAAGLVEAPARSDASVQCQLRFKSYAAL